MLFVLPGFGIEPRRGARGELSPSSYPLVVKRKRFITRGNRRVMRVGLAPFRKSSLRKPDCQQPPRFFNTPTALPLNKISQRILSVLVFSVAWTLRFAWASLPAIGNPCALAWGASV